MDAAHGLPAIDDAAVDIAVRKESFTGVATVDVGDERCYERVAGYAHRALELPPTASTRFAIASGGKTFTALAVLRLIEQGLLTLETPVRGILGPDLPLIDDAVTVEHLLTHTSGIGDYMDEESEWEPADYVLSLIHISEPTRPY